MTNNRQPPLGHRQSPLSQHRQSPHHSQSPLPQQVQQQQQFPRQSLHLSSVRSVPSPPEQRYPTPGVTLYTKQGPINSYPYGAGQINNVSVMGVQSSTKPKVSSPAPVHAYPRPGGSITVGAPLARVQDVTIITPSNSQLTKPVITPSPYQQLSHHQLPPTKTPPVSTAPPPAHSHKSSSVLGNDPRAYSLTFPPVGQHSASPIPSSDSAESSALQAQPLDLRETRPPKRHLEDARSLSGEHLKRLKLEAISPPLVESFDRASPLLANAKPTVPVISNATPASILNSAVVEPSSETGQISISITPASLQPLCSTPPQPGSSSGSNDTPSVTPPVPSASPGIVSRTSSSTPEPKQSSTALISGSNSADRRDKLASPKAPSYSGHKLKKAWLQRHKDCWEDSATPQSSASTATAENSATSSQQESADSKPNENCEKDSSDVAKSNGAESPKNKVSASPKVRTLSESRHQTNDEESSNSEDRGSTSSPPVTGSSNGSSPPALRVNPLPKTSKVRSKPAKRLKENRSSVALNGHLASKSDESSSSEGDKSPKRLPPKLKRKRFALPRKFETENTRKKLTSTSSTDSDKESGSEKESDTSVEKKAKEEKPGIKEVKKRGRKPKNFPFLSVKRDSSSGRSNGEGPKEKKRRHDSSWKDPFPKPPISQLKKTGESFLQDGPCFEVAPKLAKCRECRWTPNQRSRNNIFCRFYAFRRLRYTKSGQLAIAGFSDPHKDPSVDDLSLWLPNAKSPPADLDLQMARFLLCRIGDQFCDLLKQESEALSIHISEDKKIAWKRVVQGVREMCDVCETTLFNFHWACSKCGFVVCIDCYKGRKNGCLKIWGEPGKDRDDLSWLFCTNRQPHEQEKLMLTQIIAGDCVTKLSSLSHESRQMWEIPVQCGCPLQAEDEKASEICKDVLKRLREEQQKKIADQLNGKPKISLDNENSKLNAELFKGSNCSLNWFADMALLDIASECAEANHVTNNNKEKSNQEEQSLEAVVTQNSESQYKNFALKYCPSAKWREPAPVRCMTLQESRKLYPGIPHMWLCDGKLLRLLDPEHPGNYVIFQDQWKRGQPVVVSDVVKKLSKDLWHPESFIKDFGDIKNDLVNCMNGNLVPNQPMRKFWEGFESPSRRIKDDKGNGMLLKLKDWPPGEDFAEMLPSRFTDLMNALPLSEYTHRTGRLNLASRLPECFVRPDLGPKMYNAYGSAIYSNKGTTNLHLDISDAVNVMVYVGIPKDGDGEEFIKGAYRAIDEAGCDILTRRRVREKGEIPGALWHIYHAKDAVKIRELLTKVAVERGIPQEPHHDPIHDQSWYLDGYLRERLYKEYAVEGYSIVQCLGDAVFIPAGAPHQVRNLHNCIKVAHDFVSPENVSNCFTLTQEFRNLSDTHSNHEDKLQIKNIMYHAVKDSLSVLNAAYVKAVEEQSSESSVAVVTKDKIKKEESEV